MSVLIWDWRYGLGLEICNKEVGMRIGDTGLRKKDRGYGTKDKGLGMSEL